MFISGIEPWLDAVSGQSFTVVSLDEISHFLADDVEQFIIEAERQENTHFLYGNLSALWTDFDGERFRLSLAIYFVNRRGRVLLKNLEKAFPLRLVDESSAENLKNKREIRFEITAPNNG